MEGRDLLAAQRKYQDMINDLDNLDEKLVRKAADTCVEKCIGTTDLGNTEIVNACMRRCDRSLPLLDRTVQQELTNLQGRMQLCALDCSDKMAAAIPPGTKEGDPAMQQGVLKNTECTANCAAKSVSLVAAALGKISAAADLAAKPK